MRTLFAIAALLLASTAAQAQYSFDYGGRTIRIDPDRGTVSIPGVYDNTGKKAKRSRDDQDSDRPRNRHRSRPRAIRKRPAPTRAGSRPRHPAATAAEPSPAPRLLRPPPRQLPPPRPRHSLPPARPRRRPSQDPPPGAAQPAPAPVVATAPAAPAPAPKPPAQRPRRSGQLAARLVADRREGGQGSDRAMRPQPLRIFGGRQVEPERRAGPDQHEARQGRQMERADSRSEQRQHL